MLKPIPPLSLTCSVSSHPEQPPRNSVSCCARAWLSDGCMRRSASARAVRTCRWAVRVGAA